MYIKRSLRGKIGFVKVFKILARYRSENNFVRLSNYRTLKLLVRMSKLFAALLIIHPTQLF